jgi:hypothetical protein
MDALLNAVDALNGAKEELEKHGFLLTWELVAVSKNTISHPVNTCTLDKQAQSPLYANTLD